MMIDLAAVLPPDSWLKLNSQLQTKKNALRRCLKDKGILKRGADNTYDHYKYFSEAQYKELFTELFSDNGLELKFNEVDYSAFDGTEKMNNGRAVKLEFSLFDIETGFFETTVITGEGIDKGDKAGYKAYTGALKYYFANTFNVATGDDPERESPEEKMKPKAATPKQLEYVTKLVTDIPALLGYYHIDKLEDLSAAQASEIIKRKGSNNNG